MKLDTALAAPTPAVAIGSKAAPQPAKAPMTPTVGIGESIFIFSIEVAFSQDEFFSVKNPQFYKLFTPHRVKGSSPARRDRKRSPANTATHGK